MWHVIVEGAGFGGLIFYLTHNVLTKFVVDITSEKEKRRRIKYFFFFFFFFGVFLLLVVYNNTLCAFFQLLIDLRRLPSGTLSPSEKFLFLFGLYLDTFPLCPHYERIAISIWKCVIENLAQSHGNGRHNQLSTARAGSFQT